MKPEQAEIERRRKEVAKLKIERDDVLALGEHCELHRIEQLIAWTHQSDKALGSLSWCLRTRQQPSARCRLASQRHCIDLRSHKCTEVLTWVVHRLNASTRTPDATSAIPDHSRKDGRSPRKMTANNATRTKLNLSTGATWDAAPIFSARK